MTKKYLLMTAALTACASLSWADTYYWSAGLWNGSNAWYNAASGGTAYTWSAISSSFTNGTAVIERRTDATTGQTAFGIATINIDTWNDTTASTSSTMWHMYAGLANTSVTMKNLNKSSAGILQIRKAAGTSNFSLSVTDAITLSGGKLRIGTQDDYTISTSTGFGIASLNINSATISNSALAVFASSNVATFGTVSVNGGTFNVINGSESSAAGIAYISPTINTLNVQKNSNVNFGMNGTTQVTQLNDIGITTLNIDNSTSSGSSAIVSFNADTLNIGTLNVANYGSANLRFANLDTADVTISTVNIDSVAAGSAYLNLYDLASINFATLNLKNHGVATLDMLASGVSRDLNITNFNIDSTSASDSKITFAATGGLTNYNVTNLTSTGNGTMYGQTVVNSNATLDIANATHSGASGTNNYGFRVSGNGTVNADNISITGGAMAGYGWIDVPNNNTQYKLKYLNLGNVNVTEGKLMGVVETMLTSEAGTTITVSGQQAYADLLAGTGSNVLAANLQGAVVVANGGDFTIRRSGGLPNIIMSDLTLTSSESTANKGSKAQISSGYQYRVNSLALNNLNFNYAGSATAKQSTFTSFTTAAVDNSDIGSESTVITNLLVDANADGKVIFGQNSAIGGITVNGGGKLTFNTYQKTTAGVDTSYTATVTGNYVNSGYTLALDANSKLSISGDLINSAYAVSGNTPTGLSMYVGATGSSLTVVGALKNNGVAEINSGMASGASASMSLGGITSDYVAGKTEERRIVAAYTGGVMNMNLTGAGNYIYTNRIHDFGKGSTAADLLNYTGKVAITKNGTGTQYLAGYTYYRGDTTVNAGALYIHADGADNSLGLGVAAVVLNGGRFGACGFATSSTEVTAIGTVKMTSLTWDSSAVIAVDLGAGATSDLIAISGAFDKAAGDGDTDVYTFDFAGDILAETTTTEYRIIAWEDLLVVGFDVSDFAYTYEGSVNEGFEGYFTMKNDGLYFTQVVPEPAAFAAIFGALALGFAAYRRKRK